MAENRTVLVVGGTGHLGYKVVSEVRQRGYGTRVLVRPASDAARLAPLNVDVVRGDMLDRASLNRAMDGCEAVISTAIGYSNRKKGDRKSTIDTQGNQNLADVAAAHGIRRFVFCSILTCDNAPQVPHFWHKKLAEDYLENRGVPFVALRPGAFLDQGPGDFWVAGLRKGKLRFPADPDVALTFLHTSDLARYLAHALDIEVVGPAERIDIGTDRPVSITELAGIMTHLLGRSIKPQVPPWSVVRFALSLAGLFNPGQRDLKAMMAYIQQGSYVADLAKQKQYFGEVPTTEASVERYLREVRLLPAAKA